MNKYSASHRFSKHRARRGFTLIEVMIVVAVIGILSAIALPSYFDHIRKARRVDAKNALLDMASRQERFFSTHNTYTSDLPSLGYGGATSSVAVNSSGTSYYTLRVTASAATASALPGFSATATPTGSQTADTACYAYALNELGVQTNADSSGAAITGGQCW